MDYYRIIRREIGPLLPSNASRILEVGAGAGSTLKWLKTVYPQAKTTAVEINATVFPELRANVDVALGGSIDELFDELSEYDLILLLDVLEHLPDPNATLRKLATKLTQAGAVIVSLPNVAHLSVSVPLLMCRRFNYQDAGILDRTHLRFFVEETAVKLLNEANFTIESALISGVQGPRARTMDLLSCGLLRHHLAKQYIMLGRLSEWPVRQPKIEWKMVR